MLTRIISGFVLTVTLGTGMILGGNVLFLLFAAISFRGMYEMYRVYKIDRNIIGFTGYFIALMYFVCLWFGKYEYFILVFAVGIMLLLGAYVITFPKFKCEQIMMSFFAVIYVAVMLSFIYRIRLFENGVFLVWLVFICSWIADTFAYFVGVAFGKHKMTPKLSPKKTIEGAVGGIIGPMIVGGIYGAIINSKFDINTPLVFSLACGVGAIISIFGDLAASAIKREHDVKDYGRLIPGHGGVLDRFDSVIFTAPAVYIVLQYFIK